MSRTRRSTSRGSALCPSASPPAAPAGRSSCGSTHPTGRWWPRRRRSPRPAVGRTGPTWSWRCPNPPEGTHELFVVFRGGEGGLMNLNFIDFVGKGAAISESPEVTAAADPVTGTAPLTVSFDGQASDPDGQPGDALTYLWDFGVAGTTTDTSTELDPTYTYERPGNYTATLTVTDPTGQRGSGLGRDRGDAADACPTGTVRSDEFERQRARHEPLDRPPQQRQLRGRGRPAETADRQRLDLRARNDGAGTSSSRTRPRAPGRSRPRSPPSSSRRTTTRPACACTPTTTTGRPCT